MAYRYPTTQLDLPYQLDDIKCPVNRISDNTIFNNRLSMLNDGFNVLLDYSSIVDNTLPYSYNYVYYNSNGTWSEIFSGTYSSSANHDYQFIDVIQRIDGKYIYILAKSNMIRFYEGVNLNTVIPSTSLTLLSTFTTIKGSGNQVFNNISIVKYKNNLLYVYDSFYVNLIIYDITEFINNNPNIYSAQKIKRHIRIRDLIDLTISEDYIYGITTDSIIKMDDGLNYISEIQTNTDSNIHIEYDENSNYNIVISDTNIEIYNDSGILSNNVLAKIETDEIILHARLSLYDVNNIYILSNKRIAKSDLSQGLLIGYFKLNNYVRDKLYVDFCIKEFDDYDEIFLLDENKIHYFRDKLKIIDLYSTSNLLNIKNLDDAIINDLELEQDFVFNTSFQKLWYNHLLLYNSILYS